MIRRTILATVAAATVLAPAAAVTASPADAAQSREFLRVYPKCKNTYLTNGGSRHQTCQTTAWHFQSGKRHAALTTWDKRTKCHMTKWRVNTRWTTKGEPFRATCWEKGRFRTYGI